MIDCIRARRHTLPDMLRRTAQRFPGKVAILCGSVRWTYAELEALTGRLAAGLAASGLAPGDRVGVLARNSHAFVALRLALGRLGATLVPLNVMLKAEEVAFILDHAGVSALAVDSGLAGLAQAAAKIKPVDRMIWLPSEAPSEAAAGMLDFHTLCDCTDAPPEPPSDDRFPLQIMYTSGTESRPKGAVFTHEAVLWHYVSVVLDAEVDPGDVMLHALPLFHCAQLDAFLGPGLYRGTTNVITAHPTPESLLALIRTHEINSFFAPPTVWLGLLHAPQFDPARLASLAKGYYGASIMPIEVLKRLMERLPWVRWWNLYGQTEIAPVATALKPEDQQRKPGSCGRPVTHVETRVVDESMRDAAVGEVGEIVHRSPHLMQGYYQDEERTAAAFAGGWFHSGDLATVDAEGYISVVDRKKDMIKTGGENVASREVEEMIYRLRAVREVAVIGLPDPKWVEAVTAVIVLRDEHPLNAEQVLTHCRDYLAGFKCPKRVIFTEALPKSPSGKILKRELRSRYGS